MNTKLNTGARTLASILKVIKPETESNTNSSESVLSTERTIVLYDPNKDPTINSNHNSNHNSNIQLTNDNQNQNQNNNEVHHLNNSNNNEKMKLTAENVRNILIFEQKFKLLCELISELFQTEPTTDQIPSKILPMIRVIQNLRRLVSDGPLLLLNDFLSFVGINPTNKLKDTTNDLNVGSYPPPLPKINNEKIYRRVFTHVSYANELYPPATAIEEHNERLEFLGDSYLNHIITRYIYARFPNLREGKLTSIRSKIVNNTTLDTWAKLYHFEDRLQISSSFVPKSPNEPAKMLADSFEAYIAGVIEDRTDKNSALNELQTWLAALAEPVIVSIFSQIEESIPIDKGAKQRLYLMTGCGLAGKIAYHTYDELISLKNINLKGTPEESFYHDNKHAGQIIFAVFLDKMIGHGVGKNKSEAGTRAAMMAVKNKDIIQLAQQNVAEESNNSKALEASRLKQAIIALEGPDTIITDEEVEPVHNSAKYHLSRAVTNNRHALEFIVVNEGSGIYAVDAKINGDVLGRGYGTKKKDAENRAAMAGLRNVELLLKYKNIQRQQCMELEILQAAFNYGKNSNKDTKNNDNINSDINHLKANSPFYSSEVFKSGVVDSTPNSLGSNSSSSSASVDLNNEEKNSTTLGKHRLDDFIISRDEDTDSEDSSASNKRFRAVSLNDNNPNDLNVNLKLENDQISTYQVSENGVVISSNNNTNDTNTINISTNDYYFDNVEPPLDKMARMRLFEIIGDAFSKIEYITDSSDLSGNPLKLRTIGPNYIMHTRPRPVADWGRYRILTKVGNDIIGIGYGRNLKEAKARAASDALTNKAALDKYFQQNNDKWKEKNELLDAIGKTYSVGFAGESKSAGITKAQLLQSNAIDSCTGLSSRERVFYEQFNSDLSKQQEEILKITKSEITKSSSKDSICLDSNAKSELIPISYTTNDNKSNQDILKSANLTEAVTNQLDDKPNSPVISPEIKVDNVTEVGRECSNELNTTEQDNNSNKDIQESYIKEDSPSHEEFAVEPFIISEEIDIIETEDNEDDRFKDLEDDDY